MDTKCNGWANRETWLVSLWFGDTLSAMADDGDEITVELIRDIVEGYIDEILPAGDGAGFIRDMMSTGSIDWTELANHYANEEEVTEG